MLCYQITNIVNGKAYIGLTTLTLAARWSRHVRLAARGVGYALHAAIRAYGVDSFLIDEVAMPLNEDPKSLAALECELISQAESLAPGGYNLTRGGDGVGGCDETARKISASLTGKKLSDAHRAALKAGAIGRKNGSPSSETRAKISASNIGRHGIAHTPESKEKCRLAGLKRKPIPMSEALKEKLRAANVGRFASAETKAKMSAAHRARHAAKVAAKEAIQAVMMTEKQR